MIFSGIIGAAAGSLSLLQNVKEYRSCDKTYTESIPVKHATVCFMLLCCTMIVAGLIYQLISLHCQFTLKKIRHPLPNGLITRKERFVIAKRNQPAAALVSSEDLLKIEKFDNVGGLSETIGKWDCFDEISESLKEITLLRNQGGEGRNVSI